MSAAEDRYSKRRMRSSYITVVMSISLVLFMLGILGLIVLQADRLSTHVKENIGFSVFLKEDVKEVDIVKLQKSLDAADHVKSTAYVDSDEAAEQLAAELGEDFVDFLEYNPLMASIDVHLHADYANPDSIAWIESSLLKNPKVKEVHYQRDLVNLVNENIRKISIIIVIFSVLLFIIALALINNSIRLAIYSKRFVIKTMQLVGATPAFIRKPFVATGIGQGVIAAVIAIGMLTGVIFYSQHKLPELFKLEDVELFGTLFALVLVLGIIITWISTTLAVRKFLNLKRDRLY